MKINKIQLKNFKRFTDLTINLEDTSPRVVLLIGPNGCGKSCVFDAFEVLNTFKFNSPGSPVEESYHAKKNTDEVVLNLDFKTNEDLNGRLFVSAFPRLMPKLLGEHQDKINFYGRSAFRYIPKIEKKFIGNSRGGIIQNIDRPRRLIDLDTERFDNDIDFYFQKIISEIQSVGENSYVKTLISNINMSFQRIFINNQLKLTLVESPVAEKPIDIIFEKDGFSVRYFNLSAGEKSIFMLLFNLYVRKDLIKDAIYFFDEIDLHINTSIQYNLIHELCENKDLISENSQIWIASHSFGFINYARNSSEAQIIDFDNLNYEITQQLKPENKLNLDVYEVSIPKNSLAKIFSGKTICFCENKDDKIYNSLNIENVVFVGLNNRDAVIKEIESGSIHSTANIKQIGLIDRDLLADSEFSNLKNKFSNLKILNFYSIENYLYHPDNVEEYFKSRSELFNKVSYIESIKNTKNRIQYELLARIDSTKNKYYCFSKKIISKDNSNTVNLLQSDNFENFYKLFSVKDFREFVSEYFKNINTEEREHRLARTNWFKDKIQGVLN